MRTERSAAALLASILCSSTASLALVTALGKQVYDITQRELDLGLLGLAEFAPAALLVLITGAIADRADRRRVGAAALTGEAAAAAALALYVGTKPSAVGPIFGIAFAFGIARAFAAPAVRALPADVVAPERLPWLIARWSGAFQIALIVGPVLGGFLYVVDPRLPYVAAAGLLLTAAGALQIVRPVASRVDQPPALLEATVEPVVGHGAPVEGVRPGLGDALQGVRFIRRQPILLGAISLDLFAVLFGGAVALLPAVADARLGVGAVGLGWLRAATGIGAGAVTLLLAVRPVRRHVGRTLLVAVAVFGAATIGLGVTRSYAVAFVSVLVLGGADAISVFIRATLVPLVTPAEMRGRVLAVENVFIGASNELGAFESGVAGELLGPATAIGIGGVATLLIAVLWAVFFRELRSVDEFPSPPG